MEAGFVTLLVSIAAIIGAVVGVLIGKSKAERRYARDTQYTQGTLNIDCSDPEFEPGLFLGLGVSVEDVISRKYVVLDINLMLKDSRK